MKYIKNKEMLRRKTILSCATFAMKLIRFCWSTFRHVVTRSESFREKKRFLELYGHFLNDELAFLLSNSLVTNTSS